MKTNTTNASLSYSTIPATANPQTYSSEAGFLARYPAVGWILFLLGGLIFVVLAYNVRTNGPLLAWDQPIDQELHARATHDNPIDFYAMKLSATFGRETAAVIMLGLGLFWLFKRKWHQFSMLLLGVVGGNLWFLTLSNFFMRHRPVWPDPLDPLPGPGFPSGHSIASTLLYGLILILLLPTLTSTGWRLLAALDALLIVLLVGYSRLYMGAHFPTDVLAGYSFGLAWGGLVYTTLEVLRLRRMRKSAAAAT